MTMTGVKKKNKKNNDIPLADVYSLAGKKTEKFKLNPDIFNAEINKPLLHQVLLMYMANRRQGNASTKTRANVRGGGKKPWRQKGTGRARAGSNRSPLWRGGGVVFGPHPRDYGFSMPKKTKRLALLSSLSAKTKDNKIMVLDKDPEFSQPKTREMAKILEALKAYQKRNLYLYAKRDENLMRSCRNIKGLTVKLCDDFNAHDVLSNANILFSKETHDSLVKRLKK